MKVIFLKCHLLHYIRGGTILNKNLFFFFFKQRKGDINNWRRPFTFFKWKRILGHLIKESKWKSDNYFGGKSHTEIHLNLSHLHHYSTNSNKSMSIRSSSTIPFSFLFFPKYQNILWLGMAIVKYRNDNMFAEDVVKYYITGKPLDKNKEIKWWKIFSHTALYESILYRHSDKQFYIYCVKEKKREIHKGNLSRPLI